LSGHIGGGGAGLRAAIASPSLDLWRLKCRTMVTSAEGNVAAYAELARQDLDLAKPLDARGRLDDARRMVAEIV
jgi:succinate dehydrogenase/fumarate reductase flavoprotein subunit